MSVLNFVEKKVKKDQKKAHSENQMRFIEGILLFNECAWR